MYFYCAIKSVEILRKQSIQMTQAIIKSVQLDLHITIKVSRKEGVFCLMRWNNYFSSLKTF